MLATAVAALTLAGEGHAQAQPAAPQAGARPKICLVLSGGGARGAAHVGVLKVLQEMRVPVDCVTGTSMGAIVGAAYASGTPIDDMQAVLSKMSTRLLFKDLPPREERSVHLKRDDATNLAPFELGLGSKGLALPRGLVSGVQLESVLRELSRAGGIQTFDRLPIPFRAVATDLITGKPVVLSQGDLPAAMRASMSVPGAIEPVRLQGHLLVDGGLTNNLPVDVARAMGADLVIAVNLGTPLGSAESLNSILGVTAQMVSILTEQNVQRSLASLGPRDILILPLLGEFSAADFDHLDVPVPLGEAAARAVAAQLAPYALPPEAYVAWEQRRIAIDRTPLPTVDEIRFEGLQRVNPATALAVMETQVGQPVDQKVLDRDMRRVYGTGDFEHVGYRFLEEPGQRVLAVDAAEKSWGPNYLRMGLGLSSDFKGDSFFNLLASYRMTWLNDLGGEFRTDAQVGRTNRLGLQFHQPLQKGPGLFVVPRIEHERRTTDVFSNDQRVASYDTSATAVALEAGAQFTRYGETRLGLVYSRWRTSLDTGLPVVAAPDGYQYEGAVTWRALVDQLDSVSFPRAGYGGSVEVLAARKELGSEGNYTRLELAGTYVKSFDDHTFQLGVKVGQRYGSDPLPPVRQFQWGGMLQQSGYPTGALIGEDLRFARLVYYNRVARWQLLEGIYVGGSLEVGRMGRPLVPGNQQGTLYSGSLLFGVDTPIGPLYLAAGHAARGYNAFYLFLGRP
nr:patatin-like phospholipase family protein [Ramlibacter paludis]